MKRSGGAKRLISMQKRNLKRLFLYSLIASVTISATLGVFVILFGDFGEYETKILLTTLTITCMSILGLACGASLDAGRGRMFPTSGIALAIISAVLWIALIWWGRDTGEVVAKVLMSTTLLAVAFSHISLVSLARLDKRFVWASTATYSAVALLVLLLLGLIWGEGAFESELVMRSLGVLSIVVATFSILIPILYKLSDNLDEVGRIDEEIERLKAQISKFEMQKKTASPKPKSGE